MDATTFDRLVANAVRRPTRRATLRLLAGGLLGGVLARRSVSAVRADERPDGDGDGLYDDDEWNVYGTDAYTSDTDGDGVGDGESVAPFGRGTQRSAHRHSRASSGEAPASLPASLARIMQ